MVRVGVSGRCRESIIIMINSKFIIMINSDVFKNLLIQ